MSESALELRDLRFDAADKQASEQDWLQWECKQLSAGSYQGRLRDMDFEHFRVVVEEQNQTVQKLGVMSEKYCTVSYAHNIKGELRASEYRPDENTLFLIPCGAPIDVQLTEDVETVYFRFEQAYLLDRLRILNPEDWTGLPDTSGPFDAIDRKPIEQCVNYLLNEHVLLRGTDRIHSEKAIEQELHDLVLMAVAFGQHQEDDRQPSLKARRLVASRVGKAMDFIKAAHAADQCPGIVDLCEQLNIGERTLLYSFNKHLGLSPQAYLKIHRLNQVRAQLINPINSSDSVTSVAMNWHFLHMGQFSQDYKKMFEELPSATLKNNRFHT